MDNGGGGRTSREVLLAGYATYDESVDAVSSMEALCTRQQQMQRHVRHFERFPNIVDSTGAKHTPDFTTVFTDGTGLVGEVARISLHDRSIDKLCDQLARYDTLQRLPTSGTACSPVGSVQVMVIVPYHLGHDALDRIVERIDNPDHPYTPTAAPIVVQFSRTDNATVLMRPRDPRNGSVTHARLAVFFTRKYQAPADFYKKVRVNRPFVNDPVDPLYLATFLWTKVLPTMMRGDRDATVTISQLTRQVTTQYERCRTGELRRALDYLHAGGFVVVNGTAVTVHRPTLRRNQRDNFQEVLADRICTASEPPPARSRSIRTKTALIPAPGQQVLFGD